MAGKQGWRPTKFQLAVGVVGFLVLALVVAGYWIPLQWTGFGAYTTPKSDTVEYIHEKTVWDWLQLLVIPAVLASTLLQVQSVSYRYSPDTLCVLPLWIMARAAFACSAK